MFTKYGLSVILVASILTLDSSNGESHPEFLALASKHPDILFYPKRPVNYDYYSGQQTTCADKLNDDPASTCCEKLAACNDVIPPQSTKYGIENPTHENLYGCACNLEFRDCLHTANRKNPLPLYEDIGSTYFDLEPRKCFLTLYNPNCDGPFYDHDGNSYDDNWREYYFCPREYYVKKYNEPLVAA